MSYINIGHTYFRTDGQVLDIGFGKEVWYGMFSSVRPNSWTEAGTRYLATLNVNIVMKVYVLIFDKYSNGTPVYSVLIVGGHLSNFWHKLTTSKFSKFS